MRSPWHLLFLLLVNVQAMGQQQATFAQYMFNGLAINPAYAGQHKALSASVLSRFQNIGLPGAPSTHSFSVHAPLVNQRIAVGALIVHDKIGVISQTGLNGIYAYRLPVSEKINLTLGIQAGLSSYNAAYSNLETYQPDGVFLQDVRQVRPNIGTGAFLNAGTWYLGLSAPHLVNNVFTRGSDLTTVRQNVPIMLSGGYVMDISSKVKFKPNGLLKLIDNRPVEMDINANFLIDGVLWTGISYRTSNSLNFLLDLQVTDQLRFGYSYTAAFGRIKAIEIGSHEFFLGYILNYKMKGVVSPRYF
jgi:type IX secretion system PorP/SprF family membrane protein